MNIDLSDGIDVRNANVTDPSSDVVKEYDVKSFISSEETVDV
eukprot:CAMPEP_0184867678 /NCGR_PEP_ID=MMETSP0580-20130426/27464_1 /TAXON_ID=1118495 /ORGANISM="Dactyliosolen fragilissimus" /LENGTH=41 /DNA_ID= /DNA_START= /DNA_END= /DNA_ORIENTATION=